MTILKNIVTDYSAPTDGTSDARSAFITFRDAHQAAAEQVILTVPAHTYQFHAGATNDTAYLFKGIPDLVVSGTGATLADNSGTGSMFLGSEGIGLGTPATSARIATVSRGRTQVQLVTLADHTLFTAGGYVCVAAFDLQGAGNPPNPFFFEYAQIVSKDTGTGIITLDRPLKNSYDSTWPLHSAGNESEPDLGGPATIYVMPDTWDCSIEFIGLTISAPTQQLYARGRYIKFTDCEIPTVAPTVNEYWIADGCDQTAATVEVDKMVENLIVSGGSSLHIYNFQSSTPNYFEVSDSTFDTRISGTPRKSVFSNSTIPELRLGCSGYGRSDTIEASNCTISAITPLAYSSDTAGYTISNGVISYAGAVAFGVPGTKLIFTGSHAYEAQCYVVATSQSGSNTLVKSSLAGGWPDVALQGGTVLKVGPHPAPFIAFYNCSGCDMAVDLSNTGAQGRPFASYSKRTYTSTDLNSPENYQLWGELVSINVNVITPYTGVGALTLKLFGASSANGFDPPYDGNSHTAWSPSVNLKVAGLRSYTQGAGWSGTQSGDSLSDPGLLLFADVQVPSVSTTVSAGSEPVVEIEVVADQKIYRPARLL